MRQVLLDSINISLPFFDLNFNLLMSLYQGYAKFWPKDKTRFILRKPLQDQYHIPESNYRENQDPNTTKGKAWLVSVT